MKVPAAAVAAECMGAAAAMVGLPEHRPFIANIFLFLLCSVPVFTNVSHLATMFRELCKRLALRDVGHQKNCKEKQSLKVVWCRKRE